MFFPFPLAQPTCRRHVSSEHNNYHHLPQKQVRLFPEPLKIVPVDIPSWQQGQGPHLRFQASVLCLLAQFAFRSNCAWLVVLGGI